MVVGLPGSETNDGDSVASTTDTGYHVTAFGANATDVLPEQYRPTDNTGAVTTGLLVGAGLLLLVLLGGK